MNVQSTKLGIFETCLSSRFEKVKNYLIKSIEPPYISFTESSGQWLFLFPTIFSIEAPNLLFRRSQHLIAFIEEATLEEQPIYV